MPWVLCKAFGFSQKEKMDGRGHLKNRNLTDTKSGSSHEMEQNTKMRKHKEAVVQIIHGVPQMTD
jgi:hypothetical protein